MIPLLIKPTIQGIRNRLRSRYDSTSNYIQDLFIFGFGIGIMGVIFYSTSLMIAKIQDFHDYLYLPPADPLGLIFLILMAMVVMSGAALSVGSLFLSNDLDLLLSAPIHPFTFTFGKFTHIFLMSSWMPILFLAPFLVAFGVMYEASAIFYLVTAVSLIPFFMIPNCIAVMIACIYTRLVPAHRTKEVLIVCSIIALGAILLVLETLNLNSSTLSSAEELFRIITLISMSDLPWLPSSWLGQILSSFLDGKPFPTPYIVLLFSTALSLTALTTMILELSHREGYSKARNLSQGSILFRRQRGDKSRLPNLFPIHTALITKEWKSVVRDMTQVTQLLFLLGLSVFYFYNLRVFKAVDALPVANQLSWRQFLSI